MGKDAKQNGKIIKTFNLRIPMLLHTQLKEQSKNDRRSMNQRLLVMIEEYLEVNGIEKENEAIDE